MTEDLSKVEAYERCLEARRVEFLEHCDGISHKYLQAGHLKLACQAWPLRPLFLDQERLRFISKTIYQQLEQCRARLLDLSGSAAVLAQQIRFPVELLSQLKLTEELNSPDFLSAVRPDGFYHPERFVLSEYNLGSGLLATLSYTEVLAELLGQSPVSKALALKPPQRPFQRYLELLRARIKNKSAAHIALFSPALEQKDIYPWELELFHSLFAHNGFTTELVNEADLLVNDQGRLVSENLSKPFDLLLQVTTGEYFLKEAEPLAKKKRFLTGCQAGSADHLHPLSCLLMGKGILASKLAGAETVFNEQGDFSVEQDLSHFPTAENADEYRVNKDRYVIKRSWFGKDTMVGCSSGGRAWNRIVAEALDSCRFIIQHYCPLPKLVLPYLLDGRIERVPVRFELSPFIIQGIYAGALVRYAPEMEGLKLSPSPEGMGMTIVC